MTSPGGSQEGSVSVHQAAVVPVTVNGEIRQLDNDPDRPLLEVLREDLKLTGTRYGCGEGECGACSVLLDGKRVFSCSTPVADVVGKTVTTIEGLAEGETLHPAQRAFLDEAGFQCGYCTSGMIMTLVGCLTEDPAASDQAIMHAMEGNLCRCCGYSKISTAILRAAAAIRGGQP